jgi:superfamily II DNA/RNA helicase
MVVSRNTLIALVSSDIQIMNATNIFSGRTGRIGHQGLATSFYNDRDSDLAEALVKTLLETHQVIPDFLEQHIPEGFTADGSGDTAKLHFDADSDAGDEQNGEESGNGGAWVSYHLFTRQELI